MTRIFKYIGPLAAIVAIGLCFMPWVVIESRQLIFTGMDTTGSNYGKPGILHIALSGLFLLLHFIPRVWAKRGNLLVTALNCGWFLRNFLVIPACQGGECPVRQLALYGLMLAVLLQLLSALFPDMKMQPAKESNE